MTMAQRKPSWSDKYLTIQSVAGLVSFVFGAGLLYGEFKGMKAKDVELEARQQRQFELYNKVSSDILELKKEAAFNDGYHEAMKELKKENNVQQ